MDVGAVGEQNDKGDEQPVNNEEVSCEKSKKKSFRTAFVEEQMFENLHGNCKRLKFFPN